MMHVPTIFGSEDGKRSDKRFETERTTIGEGIGKENYVLPGNVVGRSSGIAPSRERHGMSRGVWRDVSDTEITELRESDTDALQTVLL